GHDPPDVNGHYRWLESLLILVAALAAIWALVLLQQSGAPSSAGRSRTPTASGSAADTGIPAFSHVYLLILENESAGNVLTPGRMPYLQSLIAKGALATNYQAITHPSQPNYLALFSGSTQGVKDDNVHDVNAANLADQLEEAQRNWSVTAQNVP